MHPRNCLLAFVLTLAGACGAENPDAGKQAASVTLPWVGEWSSPPCGERWFERRIDLRPDGKFLGVDLVAPCLQGMQCMWSGIVYWSGTWVVDVDRALLNELSVSPVSGPVDAPRPTELMWDSMTGAPAEESGEGELCPYLEIKGATSIPASEDLPAEQR